MKELIFNEKKYQVPTCWQEVTLKMVIDTQELSDILEEAPIISIICGYLGIPTKELKSARVDELKEIMIALEFIYTEYKPAPNNSFVFNGETYSCPVDIVEINFETWVSCQTTLYQYKNNPVLGLTRLIAALCKKEGETLDSINLSERSKEFLNMKFTDAKNVEGFFLANLIAYKSLTQLYSTIPEIEVLVLDKFNELSDIMTKQKRELGWYSPTRWLIGIYVKYLKYLKRDLERSFNLQYSKDSKMN